jgi:hypothetical protein
LCVDTNFVCVFHGADVEGIARSTPAGLLLQFFINNLPRPSFHGCGASFRDSYFGILSKLLACECLGASARNEKNAASATTICFDISPSVVASA